MKNIFKNTRNFIGNLLAGDYSIEPFISAKVCMNSYTLSYNFVTCCPIQVISMKPLGNHNIYGHYGEGIKCDISNLANILNPTLQEHNSNYRLVKFSEYVEKDTCRCMLKEITLPPLTPIAVFKTNVKDVFYAQYCTKGNRTMKGTLLTTEILESICMPDWYSISHVEGGYPRYLALKIHGPLVDFIWKVYGYVDNFENWEKANKFAYLNITLRLVSIFKFGEKEVIKAFAPGISDVFNKFLDSVPEMSEKEIQKMQDGIARFLEDLCTSLQQIDGYRHIGYVSPITYAIDVLHDQCEKDRMEQIKRKSRESRADDFLRMIECRRDLLREFNTLEPQSRENSSIV